MTNTVRIDDRVRSLLKNIFGSGAARAVNLLIALMLVPLTINSLTPADYAYLSMAIALSALSAYADLGMGFAIVNTLAGESHKAIPHRSQRAISVVWFTLLAVALLALLIVGVLALWVCFFVPIADATRYLSLLLGAACVFTGLPTGLIQRILFSRHRIAEANIWNTCGKLLSLIFVWGVVYTESASLLLLVFGVIGIPVIWGWLSVLIVFGRRSMRALVPHVSHYERRLLKPYFLIGCSYMILQLVPYVEVGIDTLLAGALIDVHVVPSLDVYTRLFTYVPALVSIALFPLWPSIAQAKSAGDIAWIIKAQKWGGGLVGALSLVMSLLLLFYGELIILQWTSQQLILPLSVLTGMAVFAVLICLASLQSIVLNGVGIIKKQAALSFVYLCVLLVVKPWAAIAFGLEGMVWSLNFCCLCRLVLANRLLQDFISSNQSRSSAYSSLANRAM